MDYITLNANAKINLSLDVLRKREDGYHEVRMIMQTIDLHDEVIVESIENGIEVSCNKHWVPSGNKNIAYKAAELIIEEYGIQKGVRIKIIKNIPVAAGLAGGSSDAAAVLKGINRLFSLGISENDLMLLGKKIGADVPFCIKGGTALAEGIGDKLTSLNPLRGISIILVKPKIFVSTAWVYNNLDLKRITSKPDTETLINAVEEGNISNVVKNMRNVLESVTVKKHSVIKDIKDSLIRYGALGSMMSGSGPTVFGIFEDKAYAKNAYDLIKCGKWECYLADTLCEER
jgi:4-diphosphocytidyl-2-C-methyl-D-erythritol kinase